MHRIVVNVTTGEQEIVPFTAEEEAEIRARAAEWEAEQAARAAAAKPTVEQLQEQLANIQEQLKSLAST